MIGATRHAENLFVPNLIQILTASRVKTCQWTVIFKHEMKDMPRYLSNSWALAYFSLTPKRMQKQAWYTVVQSYRYEFGVNKQLAEVLRDDIEGTSTVR